MDGRQRSQIAKRGAATRSVQANARKRLADEAAAKDAALDVSEFCLGFDQGWDEAKADGIDRRPIRRAKSVKMRPIRRAWLRIRFGPECRVCHVPPWLNPVDDHENWLGHRWQRR